MPFGPLAILPKPGPPIKGALFRWPGIPISACGESRTCLGATSREPAETAAGLGRGQAKARVPPHPSIGHGPTEACGAVATATAVPATVLRHQRLGS